MANSANPTQTPNKSPATKKMQKPKPLPRRKTANPFNDSNFESEEDTPGNKSTTHSPPEEPKKSSKPIISAVKCCEEKGIIKSCVQHCVVNMEKNIIAIDSSNCSKSVSIISHCIGEEIKRMKGSGEISGKQMTKSLGLQTFKVTNN